VAEKKKKIEHIHNALLLKMLEKNLKEDKGLRRSYPEIGG
jgi:hypothetical protein